jgi:hypothetical protein
MIVKKKLAGGLLQTGKVIRAAVNNPGFKSLSKNIQKRLKDSLEDQNLAKSATKYEKARAILGALKNFTKQKNFPKRLEAVEYMKSKGATKNFKGGLIRKPKLAKRGF